MLLNQFTTLLVVYIQKIIATTKAYCNNAAYRVITRTCTY